MRMDAVAVAASVLCFCGLSEVRAAELQSPIPLRSTGMASYPKDDGCTTLGPSGPVDPAAFIVRDTIRPDVGPYTVKLPGYAIDRTSSNSDVYRPYLLNTLPGNSLRFNLTNAWPQNTGSGVNLHTHGLIVLPRPCQPFGDYIFTDAPTPGVPSGSSDAFYRIDIPTTLPGLMFGSHPQPQPYPSGLYWVHAHIHQDAKDDVMAGQGALLYVGDLETDLARSPGVTPATADRLSRTDVTYLGLRDIQLAVKHGALPDNAPPGTQGAWLSSGNYNSSLCNKAGIHFGDGYCAEQNAAGDLVWLFTVNGQAYPDITISPGRDQIWRIANMSSNMTYVLELRPDANSSANLYPMKILALDGIIAGSHASATSTDLHVGLDVEHLLLMPAARAEVLIRNTDGADQDRTLTLFNQGFVTGQGGDPWPSIRVARVTLKGSSDMALSPLDITLPSAVPSIAPSIDQPTFAAAAAAAAPPRCVTMPPGIAYRRRITFAIVPNDPEPFKIGSEVVDHNGVPIPASVIKPTAFPHLAMNDPNSVLHVCPRLGERETWEIDNVSTELHNFHLHQVKFRLARPGDAGLPRNFRADEAVVDPTSQVKSLMPEFSVTGVAGVDAFHDTLPVPAGKSTGASVVPGKLFVSIPFFAKQQVGDYVFHCHILEHEDGGMMAVVQVYDPHGTASLDPLTELAQLTASGTICRTASR